MEQLEYVYRELKPLSYTYTFILKKQWKKFVYFSIIMVILGIVSSILPYSLISGNPLPENITEYLNSSLGGTRVSFLSYMLIFAICLLFSGIICSEYDKETGFIMFPKINRYKLIIAKYLANYTLTVAITAIFYCITVLAGFYYYGGPIPLTIFYSFGIALLYIFSVSCVVVLFSSFMKTVNLTIVSTILVLLIGFSVVSQLITLISPDIEPLYSLEYAGKLMSSILYSPFPSSVEERYTEITFGRYSVRTWETPTILAGITIMLIYAAISFILAAYIFKRRRL
jgi:ABC-type transport system involved in multi-copper enzyme maturation permease subunit